MKHFDMHLAPKLACLSLFASVAHGQILVSPFPSDNQLSLVPLPPAHLVPCEVRDRRTLLDCMSAIERGARDPYIKFVAWVDCTAAAPCMISIRDFPAPYYISGIGPGVSGLHRTSGYASNLIYVNNSEVHLMNFGINEERNQYVFAAASAPPPYELNPACGRPYVSSECGASVFATGRVSPFPETFASLHVENVKITGSKGSAVGAMNTRLQIYNSVFEDTGMYAIWNTNKSLGEIANNKFLSTRSAAIFFAALATAEMPVRITGNIFDGNHWGLDDCGTRACGGGQIDFAGQVGTGGYTPRFAVLANNIIRNGWSRSPNYLQMPITGVELAEIVDSVAILHNLIVGNIGTGISRNPGTILSNMLISGNALNNTPTNLYNLNEYRPQNCEGPNCPWSIPTGTLVGARDNCGGPSCPWRIDARTQGSAVPLAPLLVCGGYYTIGNNNFAHLVLPGTIPSGTEVSLYESAGKLLLLARSWIP